MTLTANYAHDAISRAVAAMPERARAAVNRTIIREARALINLGPMERQVRLVNLLAIHPYESFPNLTERLQNAIKHTRRLGRGGHWAFDGNYLIALRGHLLARRYERRFEG